MRKYQNIENKKLMLKLEKPRLLHILPNNKIHYKPSLINSQSKYTRSTSLSPLIIRNSKISNNSNNNNINQYINKNNQSPIKTYNYMKDTSNNKIRTTPMKFQYQKIPFDKVKGFKLKLPSTVINTRQNNTNINNKKNIYSTQQSYYPIIGEHNHHSTLLNNMNMNINLKKDKSKQSSCINLNYNFNNLYNKNNYKNNINNITINTMVTTKTNSNNNTLNTIHEKYNTTNNTHNKSHSKKKIIIFNENKKSLPQCIETKSSSTGSKMETREESSHYMNKSRSKSSIGSLQLFKKNINIAENKSKGLKNNFSFLKFDKINHNQNHRIKLDISSKKKILKYLDKTIKQLTKIKTIILDEKDSEDYKDEDINEENELGKNKYNKIDLSKIERNLDKDKNTINISMEGNNNDMSSNNNNNGIGHAIKKLDRTITYDNLKFNVKENQKLFNITQKSFKNFKKLYEDKHNKAEKYNNKYDTVGSYHGDNYTYAGFLKKNDYKINNYDTEITIPKLKINYNKKNINSESELNNINEKEYLNNIDNGYNIDNDNDNNHDLANFEFSD